MHLKPRTWAILALFCLLGVLLVWRVHPRRSDAKPGAVTSAKPVVPLALRTEHSGAPTISTPTATQKAATVQYTDVPVKPASTNVSLKYRLSNTTKTVDQLIRQDHSILLRNALIDSGAPIELSIPRDLRAQGDSSTYVVQSRAALTDAFRKQIADAGGKIVSYVPNNAYLVQVSAEGASKLADSTDAQAVIPWEPYYKLSPTLLNKVIEQQTLEPGTYLSVLVVWDQAEAAEQNLPAMGYEIYQTDRSPFGKQFIVRMETDNLIPLAQMAAVQRVEPYGPRLLGNDLSRTRVRATTNTVTTDQHLGLDGSGVIVAVNDSGVWADHPDLRGRVFGDTNYPVSIDDQYGHGTHVAGIIASSGSNGPSGAGVSGSVSNASFRGIAKGAQIYSTPINGVNVTQSYLQEAAVRTNALIVNNSWFMSGIFDYDMTAASWDMAVRDAMPERTNAQPILPVFIAGNSGNGSDNGQDGAAETINSPGTAKNGITVGAIENLRNINVTITLTNGTNVPLTFIDSDSSNQVAFFSGRGPVGVGSEGTYGRFKPDLVAPGTFVVSTRPHGYTNYVDGTNGLAMKEADMTNGLDKVDYGFESGTSMAAPVVSGLLALMQQGFQKAGNSNPSPALLKALLINGARSLSRDYNIQTTSLLNLQGWGLPNIANSFFDYMTTSATSPSGKPLLWVDQDAQTNVLATGESHTRNITVSQLGVNYPVRITLVWTDPPGNPAVGVKLVNDLDLIVTNLDNPEEVFVGNNISGGIDASEPVVTNEVTAATDYINNVEQVILGTPQLSGRNYSITVKAKRVNVNAVPEHTNGIAADNTLVNGAVQDYALVISTLNPRASLTWGTNSSATDSTPFVNFVTNGAVLFNQRVGANSPLICTTNGNTNQWNFYVFHNTNTFTKSNTLATGGGKYVAFITFWPPNLSRPRATGADIDMYMHMDPGMTNLDPTIVSMAAKSVQRGGTEAIYLTNGVDGATYHVGVKSEDQQSGEFSFFVYSSDEPFSSLDENGNQIVRFFPQPAAIPDGTPDSPQGVNQFGIAMLPMTIQKVIITNSVTHELGGDLFGQLKHLGNTVVLNNYRSFQGNVTWVYDDSKSGDISGSIEPDGPGHLRDFLGEEASQLWHFTMVDSSLFHTGQVETLTARITPRDDTNLFGNGIIVTIQPGYWYYTTIEVPADATNLSVCIGDLKVVGLTAELFLRRGDFPDLTNYDYMAIYGPPGGCLNVTRNDSPPLSAGRYYVGIYNPNSTSLTLRLWARIERDLRGDMSVKFRGGSSIGILDDAITNSTLFVNDNRGIVGVNVGLRVEHPRISDLTFTLVSPNGTRVMLMEARGGQYATNAGSGFLTTNSIARSATGDYIPDTNIVDSPSSYGTIHIDYDFYGIPDQMVIFYEGWPIFDSGMISGQGSFDVDYGPGFSTNVEITMNPYGGNPNQGTWWEYTGQIMSGRYFFLTFTEDTNRTTTPIKFGTPSFVTNASLADLGPFKISDFEVTPGNYNTLANPDGWTILSNQFSILTDTNLAPSGSNFMALADGKITRWLPTKPGRPYTLRYAYRGPGLVGWWPGLVDYRRTNNAVEIVHNLNGMMSGNVSASTGYVGQAFNYPNTGTSKVLVPDSPFFALTNSLSIEGWVNYAGSPSPVLGTNVLQVVTNFGHVYYLLAPANWNDSEAQAVQLGGHLVTINDTNENTWVFDTFAQNRHIWLGYNDRAVEGSWVWSSGENPAYTNWSTGSPSGGTKNAACLYGAHPSAPPMAWGYWYDNYEYDTMLDNWPLQGLVEVTNPPAPTSYVFFRGDNQSDAYALQVTNGNLVFWIQDTNGQRASVEAPCASNTWMHIAATLDSASDEMRLYTNGVLAGSLHTTIRPVGALITTNQPGIGIGQHSGTANNAFQFSGLLDEMTLYNRALSESEIFAICNATNFGKYNYNGTPSNMPNATVVLGDITSAIFAGTQTGLDAWKHESISFKGGQDARGTPLTITGQPLGMLFDSFMLAAPDPSVDYLPEESLAALRGESAYGTWKLEIWDARLGAYLTNQLLSWQLEFTFANTNPVATTISSNNACAISRTLNNGDIAYFKVEVPYGTVITTNILNATGDVILMMNQNGLPAGYSPPDTYQSAPGTNIILLMTPMSYPPLLQGRTYYYLAVKNADPTAANTFELCVGYLTDTNYLLTITDLTPEPPVTSTNTCDIITNNNLITYYSFTAVSNACSITFALNNLSGGDLNLVVSRGFPLPTPYTNYAISANTGSTAETIGLTDFSTTVVPGTWYIGVYSADPNQTNVGYCLSISEVPLEILELTNSVSYSNTVSFSTNYFHIYHLQVPSNANEADIEIPTLSGNVDLFVNNDWPPPTPSNYVWASTNPGNSPEWIATWTNSVPRLTPGDWYISVLNVDTNDVKYELLASLFLDTDNTTATDGEIITNQPAAPLAPLSLASLASPSLASGTAAAETKYIFFNVSPNTFQLNLELFGMTGNADLFVRTNLPRPRPDYYNYASTNTGTNSELIELNTNIPAGQWVAAVVNQDSGASSYFRMSAVTNITHLTNDMLCSTNLGGYSAQEFPPCLTNYDFYSFDVGYRTLSATLDVASSDGGDLVVYLRKGLPLPSRDKYDVVSTRTNGLEEIVLTHNGQPVSLTPGTWYAAVFNRSATPSSYFIYYSEQVDENMNQLTNCVPFTSVIAPNATNYFIFPVSSNFVEARYELTPEQGYDLDFYADSELEWFSGYWYAAVVNTNPVPVSYKIQAEEFLYGVNPVVLDNAVSFTNTIGVRSSSCSDQFYAFTVPTNSSWGLFEIRHPSDTNLIFLLQKDRLPLPDFWSSDYAAIQFGTNGAFFVVTPNSEPMPLSPGDWYMAVMNLGTNSVDYVVRATAFDQEQRLIDLTNGVPHSDIVNYGTIYDWDYYRYLVSSNTLQLSFEILTNPIGNVELFAGLDPVINDPTRQWAYQSTNPDRSGELIEISGSSQPEALEPGYWYVGVQAGFNAGTNIGYTILAKEYVLGSNVVVITNGTPITPTNPIAPSAIDYYAFQVSPNAIQVKFEVLDPTANVDMFIRHDLPLPTPANANYASMHLGTNNEWIVVATNSSPVPLSSGFWYLAVANSDTTEATYTVRVTEVYDTNVVVLTSCLPFTSTLAPQSELYFVLPITNQAYEAQFELSTITNLVRPANRPLTMFIKRELTLPTPEDYSYALTATNALTAASISIVYDFNATTNILPGCWFVTVINTNSTDVDFGLHASLYDENNIYDLSLFGYATNTIGPRQSSCDDQFYGARIDPNTTWALFQIDVPTNSGLGFFASHQLPLPRGTNYDYCLAPVSGKTGMILVASNSTPVPLTNSPWFLGVTNGSKSNVTYSVRVTQMTNTPPAPITGGTIKTNIVAVGGIDYYIYRVTTNASQANFEILPYPRENVDLFIAPAWAYLPGTNQYFYASTNLGNSAEFISVSTSSVTNPLTPGDWLIAVVNRTAAPVNYALRVTEIISGVTRLTNAVPFTQNSSGALANNTIDYYMFTVSTNAVRAQFDILNPSGNVDLLVHYGSPKPTLDLFDYQSTNASISAELVSVMKTKTNFIDGVWYLGVVHRSTNPVTYTIVATEFAQYGTNLLMTGIDVSNATMRVSWTNMLPGLSYHLEGCTNLSSTNWLDISPTIRATGTATNYSLDWPSIYHFFRVVEGLSSSALSDTNVTAMSLQSAVNASGVVVISWNAPTNSAYELQWSETMASDSWQTLTTGVTFTNGTYYFIENATYPNIFYRLKK